MKSHISIEAFGKINIGLEIGNPRSDGFHPIRGVFHSVGISDSLSFLRTDSEAIIVEGAFDCPMEKTSIYRAAELFMDAAALKGGVEVRVEKRIPTMGGLGGGSSDAAASLVALDLLYDTRLPRPALAALAARIGSDVPFFLLGGAAIVSGRGEVMEPIPARSDFGIVLAYPGFGISTKWAYAELDLWRAKRRAKNAEVSHWPEPAEDIFPQPQDLASRFAMPVERWTFHNEFEEMLRDAHPVYDVLAKELEKSGAAFVSITGSGSCMYGVFRSIDEARDAARKLNALALGPKEENTLYGMALHAIKPLETSLLLG